MRWRRAGCWMLVYPSGATARPRAGGGRPGAAERRCLSPGAPGLLRGEEESRRHKLPRGGPPRHPALDGTSLGASDSARPALTCLARDRSRHTDGLGSVFSVSAWWFHRCGLQRVTVFPEQAEQSHCWQLTWGLSFLSCKMGTKPHTGSKPFSWAFVTTSKVI